MLIVNKQPGGRIRHARETYINGERVLNIVREYEDGTVTDEWVPMPESNRPLLFIPNLAGDLDESYLKDIVQSFYGREPAERLDRPNITTLYLEMQERRAREAKGLTVHSVVSVTRKKKANGHTNT